jgi:transposase
MKKSHVTLSKADEFHIIELLSKGKLTAKKQKRGQALLALNKGASYTAVSKLLDRKASTISTWAKKYRSNGLLFLEDKPRTGRPLGLSGADRAKITALACSTPPKGYARWSLRLLADKLVELELVESISFKQVGLILKKTNCSLTASDNGAFEK